MNTRMTMIGILIINLKNYNKERKEVCERETGLIVYVCVCACVCACVCVCVVEKNLKSMN